jgi:hypothetical protein
LIPDITREVWPVNLLGEQWLNAKCASEQRDSVLGRRDQKTKSGWPLSQLDSHNYSPG